MAQVIAFRKAAEDDQLLLPLLGPAEIIPFPGDWHGPRPRIEPRGQIASVTISPPLRSSLPLRSSPPLHSKEKRLPLVIHLGRRLKAFAGLLISRHTRAFPASIESGKCSF